MGAAGNKVFGAGGRRELAGSAAVAGDIPTLLITTSCAGLSRASTSYGLAKTWMAVTSTAMTRSPSRKMPLPTLKHVPAKWIPVRR
jgi:hypothetical protein